MSAESECEPEIQDSDIGQQADDADERETQNFIECLRQ
jgi:hypothetical protein